MLKIDVENLGLKFNDLWTFQNISFTAEATNILSIKGRNGSGKTSLLQCLCSIIPLHINAMITGNITLYIDNNTIDIAPQNNDSTLLPNHFAYLMQDPDKQLCFPYTHEELFFPPENMNLDKDTCSHNYHIIIDLFPFLNNNLETLSLSYGQKKILLFAAQILKNPDVYLLDEPNSGLSNDLKENLTNLILALKNNGKIIIITDHENYFDEYASQIINL